MQKFTQQPTETEPEIPMGNFNTDLISVILLNIY